MGPTGFGGTAASPLGGTATPAAGCPVMIFQQCKACHDGRGTAGTQMGLLTYEDFMVGAPTNKAMPVYKMVEMRVHDPVKPMPPTGQLPAADLATIDAWVASGAPDCGFMHAPAVAGAAGRSGSTTVGIAGTGMTAAAGGARATGTGGVTGGAGTSGGKAGGMSPADIAQYLSPDGTYFIKDPPTTDPIGPDSPNAEYCFNLVAHESQNPLPMDPAPFTVAASEFYHEFTFKMPYTTKMVGLTTKPIIQNNKVLHHWLLFHVLADTGTDGAHNDEIGLQIGNELVSGWAPGGNPPDMPPGVGMEMPPPGGFMQLEFHYFNNTGSPMPDRSGVRICMTSKIPANVATLTWLGTENISISPSGGTATGTCTPGGGGAPDIHLVFASPHMHKLGSHMKTVINRAGGMTEVVVDQPFMFSDQREYEVMNIVHNGDTLTTTCTWGPTSGGNVGFGTSTTDEMCYNFVLSYPAHSMPNPGGGGIEGSSNMCLL